MPTPEQRRYPDGVRDLAERQARHLTTGQLRELGVSPGRKRAQVAAGRWRDIPYRGVAVDCGPVTGEAAWWDALISVGRSARLGGMSALLAGGLTGWSEDVTHVWVLKSTHKGHPDRVTVHESRRWTARDAVSSGIPRARPAVATVQAALWAQTPRQSALCLVLPIQQRLVRADDVAVELDRVRRHRFRSLLRVTLADVRDGAHSLGELDFARMCRERGLPEPSRQAVRRGRRGRVYLDVFWERYRVAVEVNGAGHDAPGQSMRDEVRLLDLQLRGEVAAQVSVLTLRSDPDPFFASLLDVFRSRGWRP